MGDGATSATVRIAAGEALRPPAPCRARRQLVAGGLRVDWVRRSRAGWGWVDGLDAPLGEATEQYRVRLTGTALQREWTMSAPLLQLVASELIDFGPGTVTVAIAQMGDRAVSRELICTVEL